MFYPMWMPACKHSTCIIVTCIHGSTRTRPHNSYAATQHSLKNACLRLQDLLAGTVAGTAQLLVGHPFDTVKVKLQSVGASSSAATYSGPLDAAKQTLLKEGLRGIYKVC